MLSVRVRTGGGIISMTDVRKPADWLRGENVLNHTKLQEETHGAEHEPKILTFI